MCIHSVLHQKPPLIPQNRFSSFTRFRYVTAWIFRFVNNFRSRDAARVSSPLSVQELSLAENYWLRLAQEDFTQEIQSLRTGHTLTKSSCLLLLNPIIDQAGVLRVGGRIQNAQFCYSICHPAVLHGKHQVDNLLRASTFAPRWTHTRRSISQPSLPHYRITQSCVFRHPWLHYVSSNICEASTSDAGPIAS